MKRKLLGTSLISLSFLLLTSCNSGTSLLKEAKNPFEVIKNNNVDTSKLKESSNKFASEISELSFDEYYEKDNFVVSPFSIYACLSMASEISEDKTKEEILTALNIDGESLDELYSYLHYELENTSGAAKLDLDNSIWLQNGYEFKEDCLENLSNKYFTSSYEADFLNNSENVKKEIYRYINEKTKGLLNPSFEVDRLTKAVLLNTLYLKDVWEDDHDLLETNDNYDFKDESRNITTRKFLSKYANGRVYKEESFRSLFLNTNNNFRITFMVPNDGYSVKDIYTKENLFNVMTKYDYGATDMVNELEYIRYFTKVVFPKFECESVDLSLENLFKEKLNVNQLFTEQCNFEPLLGSDRKNELYCKDIFHGAKVIVNEKGIEGGAYTSMIVEPTAEPSDIIYEEDFVVDRSFVFSIDYKETVLFSGIVNSID